MAISGRRGAVRIAFVRCLYIVAHTAAILSCFVGLDGYTQRLSFKYRRFCFEIRAIAGIDI